MDEWRPLGSKGSIANVVIAGIVLVIAFGLGLGGNTEAAGVGVMALGLEVVFVGVLVWVRRSGA